MTPALRGILVTIAVAFVAGLAGVGVGAFVFHAARPELGLHERIHHELNLTEEQHRRIDRLERDFAVRRQALELEMRAANADLAAAIREEHGYGPRVSAAVERFHGAMGTLQSETLQHVFAMREVMTPEQRDRFDDIIASALTTEPQ
jgi:Spy/CpxP family protein refolding chaperone